MARSRPSPECVRITYQPSVGSGLKRAAAHVRQGHSRRFDGVLITSGLARLTDIFGAGRHVSNLPQHQRRYCGRRGRQRESCGPAAGGRRDSILACGGLGCGIEAACWAGAGAGGADDIFCLASSSTARSAAMFWAICSCLAASCSTLRRTASRVDAKGASCRIGSVEVAATTGNFVVETDNTKPSIGTWATSISFAASP